MLLDPRLITSLNGERLVTITLPHFSKLHIGASNDRSIRNGHPCILHITELIGFQRQIGAQ
jgi:hypothetical protein